MRPLISKLGDVSLALDRLRKGGSKDSWLNSATTRVLGALEKHYKKPKCHAC